MHFDVCRVEADAMLCTAWHDPARTGELRRDAHLNYRRTQGTYGASYTLVTMTHEGENIEKIREPQVRDAAP